MQQSEKIPIYDSSLRGNPAIEEIRELLRYKNMVFQTVRRNIVVRYKRSVLGIAWTMLAPLGTSVILTFVFSNLFGGVSAYAPYVLSGLLCWSFFSSTTSDSMSNLIWGEGLLRRIYVPRTVFAVAAIGTGIINMLFGLVPLLIVTMFSGIPLTANIFFLPIPILLLSMFSLGVGLLLSTFAVYFTDIIQMYGVALTAWMYWSPIIWKIDMFPEKFLWIIKLNPMFYLTNLFREPIYYGRIPSIYDLSVGGLLSIITLLFGWWIFTMKADEFAYLI
jgi:ABC-2 type transport system permease protein